MYDENVSKICLILFKNAFVYFIKDLKGEISFKLKSNVIQDDDMEGFFDEQCFEFKTLMNILEKLNL